MLLSIEEYNPGAAFLAGIWSDLGLPNRGFALHERIRVLV